LQNSLIQNSIQIILCLYHTPLQFFVRGKFRFNRHLAKNKLILADTFSSLFMKRPIWTKIRHNKRHLAEFPNTKFHANSFVFISGSFANFVRDKFLFNIHLAKNTRILADTFSSLFMKRPILTKIRHKKQHIAEFPNTKFHEKLLSYCVIVTCEIIDEQQTRLSQ